MKIINNDPLFRPQGELAATIGFFDGVHAGHHFLLDQLKTEANKRKLPSMIITFPRSPQSVLQTGCRNELLNTLDEKIERLALSGIDYCLSMDFTRKLSEMSAKDFIQKLKEEWSVKLLLVGYDHRFGKNRSEGFEDYVKFGNEYGMEIIRASQFPGLSVSSTLIRNYLSERNVKEANRMLSYFYRLEGTIIEGDRLGRKIGFPTANLNISDKNKMIPGEGVYAGQVVRGTKKYPAMIYIGKRPTVTDQGEKRIEVHLFDFSGNLYGETLQIEFVDFIRESKPFKSTEELKNQLIADRKAAIKAF